jgi:hypothetical protein
MACRRHPFVLVQVDEGENEDEDNEHGPRLELPPLGGPIEGGWRMPPVPLQLESR